VVWHRLAQCAVWTAAWRDHAVAFVVEAGFPMCPAGQRCGLIQGVPLGCVATLKWTNLLMCRIDPAKIRAS